MTLVSRGAVDDAGAGEPRRHSSAMATSTTFATTGSVAGPAAAPAATSRGGGGGRFASVGATAGSGGGGGDGSALPPGWVSRTTADGKKCKTDDRVYYSPFCLHFGFAPLACMSDGMLCEEKRLCACLEIVRINSMTLSFFPTVSVIMDL